MSDVVSVIPLPPDSHAGRRRFIRFAHSIYGADPQWVAPLESELHLVLGPRNPLWQHAQRRLWMAIREGRDVGRIAAIADRHHNELHGERTAFFGFFECENRPATARRLLDTAAEWARSLGLDRLRGPMNPTINDECGLLIEGFDRPPVLMMTYNPPHYASLLESAEFRKIKDLLAYQISVAEAPQQRLRRLRESLVRRQPDLQLKPVTRHSLAADVPRIKRVYNEAWERNWGAVTLTEAEIDFMVKRLQPLLVDGLVWLAQQGDEPVGFLLMLPDFNIALKPLRGRLLSWGLLRALPYLAGWRKPRAMRLVALGVRQSFRGRGIEAALIAEALAASQREGFLECEASWVLEDNLPVQRLIGLFEGRRYKTYRLYERAA